MNGGRRAAPAARLAFVPVLAAGVVWIALGGGPFEPDLFAACGPLPDGAGYEIGPTWWPPGATRCTVSLPSGAERERVTVPWGEWIAVLAASLGAGLGVRALAAVTNRVRE